MINPWLRQWRSHRGTLQDLVSCHILRREATSNVKHVCACVLSCFSRVRFCATLRTIACQAPLSMGSSRQEYWSGLPCPPPGDLPDPRIEPVSLMSPALASMFLPPVLPGKPNVNHKAM